MRATSALTPNAIRNLSTVAWRRRPSCGELLTGIGEEHRAIGLLPDQCSSWSRLSVFTTVAFETPKPLRNVGAARFAALLEEFGDQLDIILGKLRLVVGTGTPEGGRAAAGRGRFACGHLGNIPLQ